MERVIEPAVPADVEPIRTLLERNRLPTDGMDERLATTLVVRDGSRVAASAALELHDRDALLRSVVVDGAARGQGLGHALTSAALKLARRHAIRDVYLLTETAVDFFPRFGFRPIHHDTVAEEVRRSVEFTSTCAATAVPMVLRVEKDVRKKEEAMTTNDARQIMEAVKAHYGDIALTVLNEQPSTCCTPQTQGQAGCCEPQATTSCCTTASGEACCGTTTADGITDNLYQVDELDGLPLKAALASLGCGNPTALAELHAGEVVLDLGSGGGIDVLLSARRVGPTGFAYGLDMTDAMLDLARANAAEAGATNVQFLRGNIAAIPLPDNSVDVIISK